MNRKENFLNAKNFAVYYGMDIDGLFGFDIVIVEPSALKPEAVRQLQNSGTIVLAYLSVIEVMPCMQEFRFLKEEDFIRIGGEPLQNKLYNTYLANLNSKRWKQTLYHLAGRYIQLYGYDGLFLDTIGDIELQVLPDNQSQSLLIAAIDFIHGLRSRFHDVLIVQNNGLNQLCTFTAGLVDGICWENPQLHDKESTQWTAGIIKRLQVLKRDKNIQVFLLSENHTGRGYFADSKMPLDDSVYSLAMRHNFLFYQASYRYVNGVNRC